MVKQTVPEVKLLVAGDPGSGKTNFIESFLEYFPPSAEMRRKNDAVYSMDRINNNFKVRLHDVNSLEILDQCIFSDVDAIFFCFSANDPESLQNLDKWMQLSRDLKKESSCFLVADKSDVDPQQEVDNRLAEKARELKEKFKIRWFIEGAFDNLESASSVFQNIVNIISPPKSSKYVNLNKCKELPETLPDASAEMFPSLSLKLNQDETNLRSILSSCEKGMDSLSLCKNRQNGLV